MNNMKTEFHLGNVKVPDSQDEKLFDKLGLIKIECDNYYEDYYLGEVVKKGETGYKIQIWVSVGPAKIW